MTSSVTATTKPLSSSQVTQFKVSSVPQVLAANLPFSQSLGADLQLLVKVIAQIQQTLQTVAPQITAIDQLKNTTVQLSATNGTITLDPTNTDISITNTANHAQIKMDTTPALTLYDQGGNGIVKVEIITEGAFAITSTTDGNPDVITVPGHNYINGDTVLIAGATGDTAINGQKVVENISGNAFSLINIDGTPVNGNGVYSGGGTCTRYYAGLLAQTVALGQSFSNYSLRLFADGRLVINNASFSGGSFANSSLADVNLTSQSGSAGNVLTLAITNGLLTISGTGSAAGTGNITIDGQMTSGGVTTTSPLLLEAKPLGAITNGAIEYDGTHIYATAGGTRHTIV